MDQKSSINKNKKTQRKSIIFNLYQHDENSKEEESYWDEKPYIHPTLFRAQLDHFKAINIRVWGECVENLEYDEEKDILIFYTRFGRSGTIKKIAWHMFEYTIHQQELRGY